jgi:hypothetical protein
MGFGEYFYFALSNKFGGYANVFAGMLALSGFLFYIFDVGEWNTATGNMFRFASMAAMFTIFVITVTITSNDHPYGLISLFALFNPLWLLMVKSLFYKEFNARTFVSGLSGPLLSVSLLTMAAFVVWVFHDQDNEWNDVTRVNAAVQTGCEPDFTDHPNCVSEDESRATCFYVDDSSAPHTLIFPENCDRFCLGVYSACSNGFILWVGPVFIGLSLLFHSFFCTFLRSSEFFTHVLVNYRIVNPNRSCLLDKSISDGKEEQSRRIFSTLVNCGYLYSSSYGHLHHSLAPELAFQSPS